MKEFNRILDIRWKNCNFPHAWHIYSENTNHGLDLIKSFWASIFEEYTTVSIRNNPDFCVINRDNEEGGGQGKYITIDQIREGTEFLYKSSSIVPFKVLVILNAEWMNNNAFNSLLKVLEEPPAGSFIFLITTINAQLPSTIRSRCCKFYLKSAFSLDFQEIYLELISIMDNPKVELLDKFIAKLTNKKNNQLWREFTACCLYIVRLICKFKANLNIQAEAYWNPSSQKLFSQIGQKRSINYLLDAHDKIRNLLDNTFIQDLDRKQAALLVLRKLISFL